MRKKAPTQRARRRVFRFSFHEHDWFDAVKSDEDADRLLLREVAGQGWEPYRIKKSDLISLPSSSIRSKKSLRDALAALLAEDFEMPAEVCRQVVELTFEKLDALLA